MQYGGSDGFSGITANPGRRLASDMLVAAGGTPILSEIPEIFGAEHLLISRADAGTGARIREVIAWWCGHATRNGASLDNNPSSGNKRGGLTTILEKSLGAVVKAGQSPLSGANLIAFTTGRGSCFGAKPTPAIKLASNSKLFRRMPEDMGQRICHLLLDTASGRKSKSEEFGYGDHEFVPWKIGATF